MKKYIFPAVAVLALLASCAKEEAVIVEEPTLEKVEIRATINNEATKTDYDLSGSIGYFHWTGQETIGRLWHTSSFGHDPFVSTTEANSNETSLVFSGSYSANQTDYFMYPIWNGTTKTGIGWSSNPFNLYLHESMVYNASAPLKNVVPMIGKVNGSGEIDFVPVSGVIAVTVKNLPSTADKITLSTTGKALSGNYRLTSSPENYASNIDIVMNTGLTATLASNAGNTTGTKSFTFSGLDKGVHVFYFPVSVGEFNDMTITIYAGSSILQTVSTTKTITVGRGQIVKFPEMDLAKATKVSISGNSNEAYIYVDAFGPDATSVKFAVATSEATARSGVSSGATITDAGEANKVNIFTGLTESGQYYLAYSVLDSSDNDLISDVKTVYFINDSDAAQLAGDYDITYSSWTCGALSDSSSELVKKMILAVSNDVTKGNIMMTEFLGYNYDVSENRSTANINWSGSLVDGCPMYGEYPGKNSWLSFYGVDNQAGLFSDSAGTYYPRNNASNQPDYHFILTSSTELTCVAGTTAFAKRSSGAWSGVGTKVLMQNVVATKSLNN